MGLSTFIEINNDFTNVLEYNQEEIVKYLIRYLNCGDEIPYTPVINKIITLHRDDKKYQKIQRLLTPTKGG